eukprot:GGOE01061751.1.p1 GENE.GGOE01061751.1~~GGOE01061751.1.p1  ORF type:complete len:351 (+),score=88.25 GGOE01061751.1:22-1053(+)
MAAMAGPLLCWLLASAHLSGADAFVFDPQCSPSNCPCSRDLQDQLAPAPQRHYELVIAIAAADDVPESRTSPHFQQAHQWLRDGIRMGWKALAVSAGVPVFFFRSAGCLTPEDKAEHARWRDTVLVKDDEGEACGAPGLSIKTLMLLRFMARQCSTVKYLLKCTDDTYVHVPRLLTFVRHARPSQAVAGYVKTNISSGFPGIRATPGFHQQTGLPKYPRYLHRGAYLLSGDVAKTLGTISYHVPFRLWQAREEVALATWLLGWNITVYDFRRSQLYLRNYLTLAQSPALCQPTWIFIHSIQFVAFETAYHQTCGRDSFPLLDNMGGFKAHIDRHAQSMLWRTP